MADFRYLSGASSGLFAGLAMVTLLVLPSACRTAGSNLKAVPPQIEPGVIDLTKPYVLHPECADKPAFKLEETAANQIRISAWNVENLFDTKHDAGKIDWEYMPRILHSQGAPTGGDQVKIDGCIADGEKRKTECLAGGQTPEACDADAQRTKIRCFDQNWTDELLATKISTLKSAFSSHMNSAPEILILTEVENQAIVSRLARELGYTAPGPAVHTTEELAAKRAGDTTICKLSDNPTARVTDSPDERGIDIAILVKATKRGLKLKTCREHLVDVGFATRNILEAEFDFNGQSLVVYGNHWPSQRSNSSEPRVKAATKLKQLIAAQIAKNPKVSVISAGDFNTVAEDSPNPFNDNLLVGEPVVKDVHTLYAAQFPKDKSLLPGTYYYGPKLGWNLLDRFFVSDNLTRKSGLTVNLGEYHVHRNPGIYSPNEIWTCRNQEAKQRFEQAAGAPIGFVAFLAAITNDPVKKVFDGNAALDCLKVVEQCAPWRQNVQNDVMSGISDHFSISVVLETK